MQDTDFPRKRQRGRPPKYDWDPCFDGEARIWTRGVHFHTKPESFRALVHATATAREQDGPWRAQTQIDKETGRVMFRFYHPPS